MVRRHGPRVLAGQRDRRKEPLAWPPVEPFGTRTSDRPDEIYDTDQRKDDGAEIEGCIALARALFVRVSRIRWSLRQPTHRRSPNSRSQAPTVRMGAPNGDLAFAAAEETRQASEMFDGGALNFGAPLAAARGLASARLCYRKRLQVAGRAHRKSSQAGERRRGMLPH
jgi:hypothetical protein